MAKIKKKKTETTPNAGKDVEKPYHSYIARGRLNGTDTLEKHSGSFLQN